MTGMYTSERLGSTTEQELRTQPELWERAIAMRSIADTVLPEPGVPVLFVGCGTSYYIGESYAALREAAGLGPTRAGIPSEIGRIGADEHLVLLSRSGTTADVLEFLDRHGADHEVSALIGDQTSPLAARVERAIDLSFADERSIVQTRFATTALALLREHVRSVPDGLIDDARAALEAPLPVGPGPLPRQVVFLGHRWTVGLAQEAALKLREAAGAWTEAYPVMEYQHGPISCAGEGTLVWAFEPLPPAVESDVRATGAVVHVQDVDPQASMIGVHRLAVHLARAAGRDPDVPPHLHRSVETTG